MYSSTLQYMERRVVNIRVHEDVKKELDELKKYQRETYEEVIKRLIKFYREYQNLEEFKEEKNEIWKRIEEIERRIQKIESEFSKLSEKKETYSEQKSQLTKEQRMILKALRGYDEVILDDISKIVSMFTIENYEANIEFAKKFLQPVGNGVYKVNKEKIKEVL